MEAEQKYLVLSLSPLQFTSAHPQQAQRFGMENIPISNVLCLFSPFPSVPPKRPVAETFSK